MENTPQRKAIAYAVQPSLTHVHMYGCLYMHRYTQGLGFLLMFCAGLDCWFAVVLCV